MAGVSSYVVCEYKNINMSVVVVPDPQTIPSVDWFLCTLLELTHTHTPDEGD